MTDRNIIRNQIQSDVIKNWVASNYFGYSVISMGVGKSKIIADSINQFMSVCPDGFLDQFDIPILILVNSKYLRDTELPAELEKWGCNHEYQIACYQTAYQWSKKIGLLIADEMDFAITDQERYTRCFIMNTFSTFLGLTGTLIEEKFARAATIFQSPPIFTYTLKQSQLDAVVNKTEVWLHYVPLGTEVTAECPYGEEKKYKWINGKIGKINDEVSACFEVLKNKRRYSDEQVIWAEMEIDKLKGMKKFWESSGANPNNRLKFLRSLESLKNYTKWLKGKILVKSPENKVLIFGEYTKDIDDVAEHYYHGKSDDVEVIRNFNAGEIRELGVVKKVNRGVNFQGLNHCIVMSVSSSITNAMQAYFGRLVRLDPQETAYVHILVSTYVDDESIRMCKNYDWANNLLNSEELSHINVNFYGI